MASRIALVALLGFGSTHVAPDARAESPLVAHTAAEPLAASSGPVATFIGFRRLGPSRDLIYVELTEAPEVIFKGRGRTLEYTMQRTRVSTKNNKNPLLARHFDSVVESAQLEPVGKNLKLVIQLRQAAVPESRVVRHGQSATLEIELRRATDGS